MKQAMAIVIGWTVTAVIIFVGGAMAQEPEPDLRSLNPENVLEKLNLDLPGLEKVKALREKGDRDGAMSALLQYYRRKYPASIKPKELPPEELKLADDAVNHIFQWGSYEPADYGKDIDWSWDPRQDIEWVAAIYRFYWLGPLTNVYLATGDEKYARAFVELTSDWIAKHPLENRNVDHYVYGWHGYPWLDIQTGIRATILSRAFPVFITSDAVTPEFLAVLLASLYDHQIKTELLPNIRAHNKAIFEQHGFVKVIGAVPEFRDSRRWMNLALPIIRKTLFDQTTEDGVQREWCLSYHTGVLRDVGDVLEIAASMDFDVPEDFRERVRRMYDYTFALTTPDMSTPMFGDTARYKSNPNSPYIEKVPWILMKGTAIFNDEKYESLARGDLRRLPSQTSYAFHDAGSYVMRNEWGRDQIYFALHCPPPPLSGHDTPDNGTFELYAFGRWLMTDSGFYFYGHNPEGRKWHRRTKVHQTLTAGGRDTAILGRDLLWQDGRDLDAIVIENQSYPDLLHRRSIWFVDHKFFVLLDEGIGSATEPVELNFQLAPGEAEIDAERKMARTLFDDANVVVQCEGGARVSMIEEEGWSSTQYGHRDPRMAFCYRFEDDAPLRLVTLIVPYKGTATPEFTIALPDSFKPGDDRVELTVTLSGKTWTVGRDLNKKEAWARR